MSKNKFFKKLLVGGLCALTATAMIGATACDKGGDNGGDDPNPPIVTTDEYTISFNLDGGSWGKNDGYTVKVEKDGTLPADFEEPAKDGHTFAGWYNGSTLIIRGVTTITSDMTLTAHWKEHVVSDLETSQWLATSGTVGDKVDANTEIASNELFSANIDYAAEYATAANASFILRDGESKQLESGLKNTEQIETNTNSGTITFEANADITLYAYVSLSDNGYGGNRTGYIYYSVSGSDGAVMLAKEVTGFSNAPTTVKVDLKEGDTLTVYAYNTTSNGARLWLFGAEAVENIHPVTVNYYYGEQLIFRQLVEDGATLTKPEDPVNGYNEFAGWYADKDLETEYTFGTLTAGVETVSVYADFLVSDVTIEYYLEADDETPFKTVHSFSGRYAEEFTVANKEDGIYAGWKTADNEIYDFENTELVAGSLKLYVNWEAPAAGSISSEFSIDSDASGTPTYTLTDKAETPATLATITLGTGSINGNKLTILGKEYARSWQTSADCTLELAEGYTYSIDIYCGSSGSARTVAIATSDGEVLSGETSQSSAASGAASAISWELGAGNYTLTPSSSIRVFLIIITAVPVQ